MNLRRVSAACVAACAALAPATACAPSTGTDEPAGGSALRPSFEPGKADRRDRRDHGDRKPEPGRTRSAGAATPSAPPTSSSPSAPSAPPTGGGGPSPSAAPERELSASLADPTGDVSGLGAPSYVDLTGAVLERTGDRFRLVVETAAALPTQQDGDRTMNVVGFADTDLDGSVDYEVWATLADTGWGTSSRNPEGARFGSDSGVEVSVSGSTLTMTFGAGILGDAASFQWSAATEHGTYEQVAAGTTAQDYGPDDGATAFPG